ncbi:MAG: MATE family efflux transporter [Gammaproteobacteria bacterium]|nr:MATE family efflux transporter [Gammaproteobacteria bacterium]
MGGGGGTAEPARSGYQRLPVTLPRLLRLAAPLVVNNVFYLGINVADTVMAGRLTPADLAAVAVASSVWLSVYLFGYGVLMGLGPVVAHHFGAGRRTEIAHDVRQALWLAVAVAVAIILVLLNVRGLLDAMQVAPHVVELAAGYLYATAWGVPGLLFYQTIRQACEGLGRTLPIMGVMSIALPINVGLNYVFIYGALGNPALGAVGCGVGSAITYWLMCLMLSCYTAFRQPYRDLGIWRRIEGIDRARIGALVTIGLPLGISLGMQTGLFAVATLLLGRFGVNTVAAHQIGVNFSALMFMVPLALSMGTTILVGQSMGSGDRTDAIRAFRLGTVAAFGFMLASAAATVILAPVIAAAYTPDPAVQAVAITVLRLSALLQLGDALQVSVGGALRGLKDTRVPMVLNAAVYWLFGFPCAWLLGVELGHGLPGVWAGLIAVLWVQALVLGLRLRHVFGR